MKQAKTMRQEDISFSFGRNWMDYLKTVADAELNAARLDIEDWIGFGAASGKSVVDVGSGSGIHSLCFYRMDAEKIVSFDYDSYSVAATRRLWEREGKPEKWTVTEGSILDEEWVRTLGRFDVVYSWGVLHHTGAIWDALQNACRMVAPNGILFISLYAKGPRYEKDLALKIKYNNASKLGKRLMIYRWIANLMFGRILKFQNPLAWNEKRIRGMNVYHDLVDWLGGLPYEVASEDEVVVFCRKLGLVLERIRVQPEGSCSIYIFRCPGNAEFIS